MHDCHSFSRRRAYLFAYRVELANCPDGSDRRGAATRISDAAVDTLQALLELARQR